MTTEHSHSHKAKLYINLLRIVIFFHIVSNLLWQVLNTAPPTWDSAGHLAISYIFADKIRSFLGGHTSFLALVTTSGYYPPFVHVLGSLVITLLGRNYEIPLFIIGTFFLSLAIYCVYLIVDKLFNNPRLAFLTAMFFSFFPHIWEQSRSFHLDLPLAALLLLAVYLLLKSDGLKDPRYAFYFFVVFGCAQLTKWYSFVYLAVPVYFSLFVKEGKPHFKLDRKQINNISTGLIWAALIAIPWYLYNLKSLLYNFRVFSTADSGDPSNVLSYESIFHYLELITSHQIGIVSLSLVVLGLIKFKKEEAKHAQILFGILLIPYVVFTLISNKDLRYIMPLTPIFAFLIAYFLDKFKFRKQALTIYVIYLVAIFGFLSFNQFTQLPKHLRFIGTLISGPYGGTWYNEPWAYSFNNRNWFGMDMVSAIAKDAHTTGLDVDHFKVLEVADNRFYSTASFDLYKLQGNNFNMDFVVPYYQFEPFSPQELDAYLANISYAIIPDNPGPEGLRNIKVLHQLVDYFKNDQKRYTQLAKFDMPDGNKITIYKSKGVSDQVNFNVKPNSVIVRAGNILLIDKEKWGISPFNMDFHKTDGTIVSLKVESSSAQIRYSTVGIDTVEIKLPEENISFEQLQGWKRVENTKNMIKRDRQYITTLVNSGNSAFYTDSNVYPSLVQGFTRLTPDVSVDKRPTSIVLSLHNLEQSVFVAYATKGWQWSSFNLSRELPSKEIELVDLIQLEVTANNIAVNKFGSTWGYFACYTGRALCFYPLVDLDSAQ
jgi:hypothetical protein